VDRCVPPGPGLVRSAVGAAGESCRDCRSCGLCFWAVGRSRPPPGARAMPAAVVRRTDTGFTVTVDIPYKSSMLDAEEAIQQALNEAGVAATEEVLKQFDADGQPIRLGATKLTSMGRVRKEYQTPYGVAAVDRHVYQSSQGGKTYCPLDQDARIVVSSTPRFAKMVAHKYAEFGAARV